MEKERIRAPVHVPIHIHIHPRPPPPITPTVTTEAPFVAVLKYVAEEFRVPAQVRVTGVWMEASFCLRGP